MAIFVVCEHCNALFMSNSFGGNGTFYMQGNRTNCPACKRLTRIADGTYTFANNTLKSIQGLNAGDLLRFQAVLAQAHDKPAAEVVQAAKDIDPTFGKLVQMLQAMGGLPLIIALIALYLQWDAAQDAAADQNAVLTELRATNAHQEQLLEGMRELIAGQDTPAPQPYSPQKPVTSHSQPTEASGQDRATKRRALKQEKKASTDNSIKVPR